MMYHWKALSTYFHMWKMNFWKHFLWVMRLLQIKLCKNWEWPKNHEFVEIVVTWGIMYCQITLSTYFHIQNKVFQNHIRSLSYEAVTDKAAGKSSNNLKTIDSLNLYNMMNYTHHRKEVLTFTFTCKNNFWKKNTCSINRTYFLSHEVVTNKMVRKSSIS